MMIGLYEFGHISFGSLLRVRVCKFWYHCHCLEISISFSLSSLKGPCRPHSVCCMQVYCNWKDQPKRNMAELIQANRMVVWFTTTYAISSYHHRCCEFESRSGRGVQHYVIKFVSDLRQVGGFLWVLRFPPPIHGLFLACSNFVFKFLCSNHINMIHFYTIVLTGFTEGPLWSGLYGSCIYNYLCSQCLSQLKLWVRIQWCMLSLLK
jgi:hypothetical protein